MTNNNMNKYYGFTFPFSVVYQRLSANYMIVASILLISFVGIIQFYILPTLFSVSVESSVWGNLFMFSDTVSIGTISAIFSHISVQHLGYNIFSLLLLGVLYNFNFISQRFVAGVVIVTGVASLFGYVLFATLVDPSQSYSVAGISGAIYGLYGLHTVYYIQQFASNTVTFILNYTHYSYRDLQQILANTYIFQYILVVLNILFLSTDVISQVNIGFALGEVAYAGHIIGFIIGGVIALLYTE